MDDDVKSILTDESESIREWRGSVRSLVLGQPPIDGTYYQQLGLSVTAPQWDVVKAFRVFGFQCHPYRNPADLERFQQVASIYAVLLNQDLRNIYDKVGVEGMKNHHYVPMSAEKFMQHFFGGPKLRKWIGEFYLVGNIAKAGPGHDDLANAKEKTALAKEKRKNQLLRNISERVDEYWEAKETGSVAELQRKFRMELVYMRREHFGLRLLHIMGNIFLEQAHYVLAASRTLGLSKIFDKSKIHGHHTKCKDELTRVLLVAQENGERIEFLSLLEKALNQSNEPGYHDEEERTLTLKFMECIWAVTRFEVEETLHDVLFELFYDNTNKKTRMKRYHAILFYGREMLITRRKPEEEEDDRFFEGLLAHSEVDHA